MSDTEPALPHVWRPYFVRLVALVVGLSLLLSGIGLWVAIPAEERALFSGFQAWTLLGILIALLCAVYGLARTRLVADADGLTIVNVFKRRRLDWAQVLAVNLRRGDPWVYLDVDDGTTVAVMAIQAADGPRGRQAAHDLRAIVERRTRTERDD